MTIDRDKKKQEEEENKRLDFFEIDYRKARREWMTKKQKSNEDQ